MKHTLLILPIIILFLCPSAEAFRFNRGETELMNLAYQEGEKAGYPELLQSIMINESVAGRWGRHGDKKFKNWKSQCYGVMQVQFYTARMVVDNWTNYKLNDEELRIRLQYDDFFNVRIARIYFKYLLDMCNGHPILATLAYNVGPGNVLKHGTDFDPNKYLHRAIKNMNGINKFNRAQGNGTVIKYIVKKGDTLFKIAQKLLFNGWKYKEILRDNPKVDPNRMAIGSVLYIKK